jgi:hypothetical protein
MRLYHHGDCKPCRAKFTGQCSRRSALQSVCAPVLYPGGLDATHRTTRILSPVRPRGICSYRKMFEVLCQTDRPRLELNIRWGGEGTGPIQTRTDTDQNNPPSNSPTLPTESRYRKPIQTDTETETENRHKPIQTDRPRLELNIRGGGEGTGPIQTRTDTDQNNPPSNSPTLPSNHTTGHSRLQLRTCLIQISAETQVILSCFLVFRSHSRQLF